MSTNVGKDPKNCVDCESSFTRTSNRQLRCLGCISLEKKQRLREYHKETYIKKGYTRKGKDSNGYKTGIGMYKQFRKDACEFCSSTMHLCVHHIDENRYNNELDNLATLCRSCHVLVHGAIDRKDHMGRFTKETK